MENCCGYGRLALRGQMMMGKSVQNTNKQAHVTDQTATVVITEFNGGGGGGSPIYINRIV